MFYSTTANLGNGTVTYSDMTAISGASASTNITASTTYWIVIGYGGTTPYSTWLFADLTSVNTSSSLAIQTSFYAFVIGWAATPYNMAPMITIDGCAPSILNASSPSPTPSNSVLPVPFANSDALSHGVTLPFANKDALRHGDALSHGDALLPTPLSRRFPQSRRRPQHHGAPSSIGLAIALPERFGQPAAQAPGRDQHVDRVRPEPAHVQRVGLPATRYLPLPWRCAFGAKKRLTRRLV